VLFGFSWGSGFALGFVIAAVSPAVVVPGLIALADRGFGVRKGIPTLVLAAASLDDVLAITGFNVALGLVFSGGDSIAWTIGKGPTEIAVGLLGGVAIGFVVSKLTQTGQSAVARAVYLLLTGCACIFGSKTVHMGGAGALLCLVSAAATKFGWDAAQMKEVGADLSKVWYFAQPMLFGLVGAEIHYSMLSAKLVGFGMLLLLVCLTARVCVSALAVRWGAGLTTKEYTFVAIAWFPKATVQAAIGANMLDAARAQTPVVARAEEEGELTPTFT
jgi:NhaP-type Na+/H+ or K+/H+ antiporter